MKSLYESHVSLRYKVYNEYSSDDKTVKELFEYTNIDFPILLIENLVVDKSHRGWRFGARVLSELLEENEDKLVIINLEYMDIDRENKTRTEKIESLINLGKYFRKLGFVDINKYFGKYSNKIGMCYDNVKYRELISK